METRPPEHTHMGQLLSVRLHKKIQAARPGGIALQALTPRLNFGEKPLLFPSCEEVTNPLSYCHS